MKNKKFIATAVSAALVASVVAPVVAGAATGEATTKTNILDVKLYSSTKAKVYYKNAKGATTYKNVDLSDEPVRHLSTFALIPWGGKTVKWNFNERVQLPQQKSFAKYLAKGQVAVVDGDNETAKASAELASAHFKNMNRLDYSPNSYAMYKEKLAALQADVAVMASKVKAINATTVEVTMDAMVDDVTALKFTIDGLDITNAAVKQTDKKTVVLTTSAQEGGKTYAVKESGTTLGTFEGISAVIPTAVKMTTPTVQGTIGNEVTVKAEVTVPEGQSKAGIPVTFNIVDSAQGGRNLNATLEVVAYTDDAGVASYSYTRYYKSVDDVLAYATGKASVFAKGNVYWSQGITITEVTEGNTLANNTKKVYKIKADSWNVYNVGTTTAGYVNLAFLENVDVTADKVIRTVKVTDTGLPAGFPVTGTNFSGDYPYQLSNDAQVQEVRIWVDKNGEGTFTLTGNGATVTPIVFVDQTGTNAKADGKLQATELQAAAPAVTFQVQHTVQLAVTAAGVQNAAYNRTLNNWDLNNDYNKGGRQYTIKVTDQNGAIAPVGTPVYVTFKKGQFSSDKAAYVYEGVPGTATGYNTFKYANVANMPASVGPVAVTEGTVYALTVGSNGEAKLFVRATNGAFVTPTVFLNNGTSAGVKLDTADLQTVGETTYFVNEAVLAAKIKVTDAVTGKETNVFKSGNAEKARFTYSSVDQNGLPYWNNSYTAPGVYQVTFQVTAQFGEATVYYMTAAGVTNTVKVPVGQSRTVKADAVNGVAFIDVSADNATSVTVNASSSLVTLPNVTASATFTNNQIIGGYNGWMTTFNTFANELTLDTKDAVKYYANDGKTYEYILATNATTQTLTKAQFENLVAGSNTGFYVVYTEEGNKVTFRITTQGGTKPVLVGAADTTKPVITLTTNALTVDQNATVDLRGLIASVTDNDTTVTAAKVAINPATVDTSVVGSSTVVTYTVADTAGNVGEAKLTVTVKDPNVKELNGSALNLPGIGQSIEITLPTGVTTVDSITVNDAALTDTYAIAGGVLTIADLTPLIATATDTIKVTIGGVAYTVKF